MAKTRSESESSFSFSRPFLGGTIQVIAESQMDLVIAMEDVRGIPIKCGCCGSESIIFMSRPSPEDKDVIFYEYACTKCWARCKTKQLKARNTLAIVESVEIEGRPNYSTVGWHFYDKESKKLVLKRPSRDGYQSSQQTHSSPEPRNEPPADYYDSQNKPSASSEGNKQETKQETKKEEPRHEEPKPVDHPADLQKDEDNIPF